MIRSAEGKIGRTVAFRLPPGEDVLEGLAKVCEKHNINNGVIVSAIGSLQGAKFFSPVPLPDKKAGYGYGDPMQLTGPIELVTADGMICVGLEGETLFHVHCAFSDQNGNAYGGHLIEGNEVLLTVDMVIAEVEGIHMGRAFDEDLEVPIFNPTQL